jgi:hypothetical protein
LDVAEKKTGHRFGVGNKAAVGNPGPGGRQRVLTQTLISRLNETIRHARLKTVWITSKNGKVRKKQILEEADATRVMHLVDSLLENAIVHRDMGAIKEIFDRVEGKVVQAVEGTGENDRAIVLKFLPEDEKI